MSKTLQLRKLADRSGDPPAEGEGWPLAGVVLEAEPPKKHDFTPSFVMGAASEGWLDLKDGKIVIHLTDRDLTYRVVRPPGKYTKKNKPPTPEQNEAKAYRVDNFFACELEDE